MFNIFFTINKYIYKYESFNNILVLILMVKFKEKNI